MSVTLYMYSTILEVESSWDDCVHNTICSHFYITLKATPWMNANWLPLGKLCEHVCAYHIYQFLLLP